MDRFLGRYSPYFYAILRMVVGLMFAMHGTQKLFGIPGNRPPVPLASMMGAAGVIELIGGLMTLWDCWLATPPLLRAAKWHPHTSSRTSRAASGRSSIRASWQSFTASSSSTSPRKDQASGVLTRSPGGRERGPLLAPKERPEK